MPIDSWQTAAGVLRLSGQLVEGIQEGLARRGFLDVRPAQGFAFVRISDGDATTADVALHLEITKQAASQLVEHLVRGGYVIRQIDARDARARLLVLTERGRACTAAAEDAAAETVETWRKRLGPTEFESFQAALSAIMTPGRVRPSW
ncbi:MAG: MarR family winged helix-turn-helix transcriptional regulator [Nocardioidaceae bacterium]